MFYELLILALNSKLSVRNKNCLQLYKNHYINKAVGF